MNTRIQLTVNKYRKEYPQLKERDKVYLLIKNIINKRLSKKLDYIKIGLFSIKKSKGLVNYKLNLLADTKIYLIFYISRLELVDFKISL